MTPLWIQPLKLFDGDWESTTRAKRRKPLTVDRDTPSRSAAICTGSPASRRSACGPMNLGRRPWNR